MPTSQRSAQELHDLLHGRSKLGYAEICDLFHPTDSVYIDPIFGVYRTQQGIRDWLVPIMAKAGSVTFDLVGEPLLAGDTSLSEWEMHLHPPGADPVFVTRGCGVRRYRDGWVVYAADYFDTAPLRSRSTKAVGVAAGSTVTPDDVPTVLPS